MVRLEEVKSPPDYHDGNSENLLKKYDIPVHHLDFGYVACCKDGRELEKIYQVLKSGQEGYYPELLHATENRIAQIKPNSKYLRKFTPVLSKNELDKDELRKITDDFDEWLQRVNKSNAELEAVKTLPQDIPEVRKARASPGKIETPPVKRLSSTDYESWDKFDAETEMLKMDLEDEKTRKQATKEKAHHKRPTNLGRFTTKAEALFEANRAKEKGNEYFKAGEYEDALAHYTDAITYFPSAILYTNRAVTYLKLKLYEKTIADCESALKHDRKNLKANLRMAQAFEALNKPDDALLFAECAIKIDPNNPLAQQIAQKSRESTSRNPHARSVRFKILETVAKPKCPQKKSQQVIPIPGSSRSQPPFFEVAGETPNRQKQIITFRPVSLETETDDECLEQHIPVKNGPPNFQDDQICLRTSKGERYTVVDNRGAPSVKTKDFEGGVSVQNKPKGKGKKSAGQAHEVDGSKTRKNGGGNSGGVASHVRDAVIGPENNTIEDARGGGEPHLQRQTVQNIHMPYTFIKTWQSVQRDGSYSGFAEIIRTLNMDRITEVVGNKIDATLLSDIINCLYRHFTVADEVQKVYETLTNLSRLERFCIAFMFLSDGDKQIVMSLMEFLRQHGRALPDDVRAHYG